MTKSRAESTMTQDENIHQPSDQRTPAADLYTKLPLLLALPLAPVPTPSRPSALVKWAYIPAWTALDVREALLSLLDMAMLFTWDPDPAATYCRLDR